MLTRTESIC